MRLLLSLLFLFPVVVVGQAAAVGDRDTEGLIDDLQDLEQFVVGFHPTAHVDQFLADEAPAKFAGGVLGSKPPAVFGPMKELVKRGPKALPLLLKHIDDQRPTRLVIKMEGVIMWARFTNRYNNRPRGIDPSFKNVEEDGDLPYVVKVGDVCLVILGQITNRPQVGVRYAPTGGVEVCSIARFPEIPREARADWNRVSPEQLYAHFVADLLAEDPEITDSPAMKRVRAYFPDREKDAQEARKKANQALQHNDPSCHVSCLRTPRASRGRG